MEYTTFETQAHDGIVTFPEAMKAYGNAKVLVTIISQESQLPSMPAQQGTSTRTAGEHLAYLQQVSFSDWSDEDMAAFDEARQFLNQWTERTW